MGILVKSCYEMGIFVQPYYVRKWATLSIVNKPYNDIRHILIKIHYDEKTEIIVETYLKPRWAFWSKPGTKMDILTKNYNQDGHSGQNLARK